MHTEIYGKGFNELRIMFFMSSLFSGDIEGHENVYQRR